MTDHVRETMTEREEEGNNRAVRQCHDRETIQWGGGGIKTEQEDKATRKKQK